MTVTEERRRRRLGTCRCCSIAADIYAIIAIVVVVVVVAIADFPFAGRNVVVRQRAIVAVISA
jgi:hypothetical protein